MKEAEKLAEEHWSYVRELMEECMAVGLYTKEQVIKMIGFHYTTATIHGYKHGKEDLGQGDDSTRNLIKAIQDGSYTIQDPASARLK